MNGRKRRSAADGGRYRQGALTDPIADARACRWELVKMLLSPDFSYRFLIGSGRTGSARHGGERTGAQLERVVAGAMRPCADWGEISRAPFPGQCAAAVRRKWARANSFW